VAETRGTSPNWYHLLLRSLPPTQKRESAYSRCMRGWRLKRAQHLLHDLNEKLPKLTMLREAVDNIGAQLEEDTNKLVAIKAVEEAATALTAQVHGEVEAANARIAEVQMTVDENLAEMSVKGERQAMLAEQAKKATAARAKSIRSQVSPSEIEVFARSW
jgi:chromosome segregation ATPase